MRRRSAAREQRLEIIVRHHDRAEGGGPPADVAVVVGTAGGEQPELGGERPIARLGRGVVIGVPHLDRVETERRPAAQ